MSVNGTSFGEILSILTAAVKSVQAAMLIGVGVESLPIDLEGRVLDSVRVTSRHTAQVRVLLVDLVVAGIVEAKNDVTLFTVDVLNEEVGDGRAVRNELSTNAFARDLVLAVRVNAGTVTNGLRRLGEDEERQSREGEETR